MFDSAAIGTGVLDLEGRIVTSNRALEQMLGYGKDDLARLSAAELTHPDDRDRELELFGELTAGNREEYRLEKRVLAKSGEVVWAHHTVSLVRDAFTKPKFAIAMLEDITPRKQAEDERVRLESQLRQAQTMEAVGQLAGGVAHDFNNLLTGILGNASLALSSFSPHHPDRILIEEVVKAAERASDLTRQLLAYAGKGRFVMRTVNLSDLVREISGLVQTSVPKNAQLRLQLQDDLPGIDADPGQVQQIIMNLVINGAEAIGPEGGTVLVQTGTQDVDEQYIATFSPADETLQPGRYVSLQVHDTGAGMSEETQRKMFDPFFSTKFAGRGLGLSAVLGIVQSHRGALKVYSEPGRGTTFRVIFPASRYPVQPRHVPEVEPLRGIGTVLVVDDEAIVRDAACTTLERYGYETLAAPDGMTAVEEYRKRREKINLVLLDLTMPLMSGEETLQQIRFINPEVRVLLTSGYNEAEAVQRFSGKGLAGFIQKPYTADALARKVREVLADRGRSHAHT
jgi:PAS domain S-box-containing protein